VGVERNVVRSGTLANGIIVQTAQGESFRNRWAIGNRIAGRDDRLEPHHDQSEELVRLRLRRRRCRRRAPRRRMFGRGNAVRNVRISRNRIVALIQGSRSSAALGMGARIA
jgi:hypothetical protein